jgi:hypothetical protein
VPRHHPPRPFLVVAMRMLLAKGKVWVKAVYEKDDVCDGKSVTALVAVVLVANDDGSSLSISTVLRLSNSPAAGATVAGDADEPPLCLPMYKHDFEMNPLLKVLFDAIVVVVVVDNRTNAAALGQNKGGRDEKQPMHFFPSNRKRNFLKSPLSLLLQWRLVLALAGRVGDCYE